MPPLDKDTFEKCVLVTARVVMGSDKDNRIVIRRCLVTKDKAVFAEFVESMEKLFGNGIKFCIGSFFYLGSDGEHVTFSSDDELAIALYLAGTKELKIGMEVEELRPTDAEVLKVENPSSDSSVIITSLESSPSQHSTPTPLHHHNFHQKNHRNGISQNSNLAKAISHFPTCPPTALYRSKIVPKLAKKCWSLESTRVRVKSTTFVKKQANISKAGNKKRVGENNDHTINNCDRHSTSVPFCGDRCERIKKNDDSAQARDCCGDEGGRRGGELMEQSDDGERRSCSVDYEYDRNLFGVVDNHGDNQGKQRLIRTVWRVLDTLRSWLYAI